MTQGIVLKLAPSEKPVTSEELAVMRDRAQRVRNRVELGLGDLRPPSTPTRESKPIALNLKSSKSMPTIEELEIIRERVARVKARVNLL